MQMTPTSRAAPAPSEFDLADLLDLLRHKMRLIAMATLLGIGLGALYLAFATPRYSAQTLLLVTPDQANLLEPGAANTSMALANAHIDSEVEILRSDQVKLRAIEAAQLLTDPEFGPRPGGLDRLRMALGLAPSDLPDGPALLQTALRRLGKAVSIRRRGLSYIVSITAQAEDPARAARIANAYAQTYIDAQIAAKVAGLEAARNVLQAQLAASQDSVSRAEAALTRLIESRAQDGQGAELAQLRRALDELEAARAQTQTRRDALQVTLETRDWAALGDTLADEATQALLQRRAILARRLGGQPGPDSATEDLRELAALDTQLEQVAGAAIGTAGAQIARLNAQSDAARAQLRQAMAGADLGPQALAALYAAQQDASIAQQQYETLLQRVRDLDAQVVVQVADSRIVSAALPPDRPSHPRAAMVMGLAALLGIGGGVCFVLLNEFYIGGAHSVSQLRHLLRAPRAVAVPDAVASAHMISVADLVIKQPMSVYSEALRRLRAMIDQLAPAGSGPGGRVIVMTSSIPSEGKSVLALSLGRTYAASGKRVLLIDADMRKPTQFHLLGISPKSGLLEFLTGAKSTDGEEFYELDPMSTLGVVLGRQRSEIPTDQLLQSEAFAQLLEAARASFDLVIIDTPPLSAVVDARYVLPLADCAVMITRAGSTGQGDISHGAEQLHEARTPATPVVAVLNMADRGRPGRYGGYYGP